MINQVIRVTKVLKSDSAFVYTGLVGVVKDVRSGMVYIDNPELSISNYPLFLDQFEVVK